MNEMLFIGVVVSFLFTELTGLVPGGLIVPAYFVLYFDDPVRMLLTVTVSLATMGLMKLLSRYTILWGRRRYALYLLVGMAVKVLLGQFYVYGPSFLPNLSVSIGYLIPGMLGREMERQGILKTLLALGIVICLLRLIQMPLMGY